MAQSFEKKKKKAWLKQKAQLRKTSKDQCDRKKPNVHFFFLNAFYKKLSWEATPEFLTHTLVVTWAQPEPSLDNTLKVANDPGRKVCIPKGVVSKVCGALVGVFRNKVRDMLLMSDGRFVGVVSPHWFVRTLSTLESGSYRLNNSPHLSLNSLESSKRDRQAARGPQCDKCHVTDLSRDR